MVERCLSLRVRRFLMLVLVVMLAFGPIMRAYADDFEGGGGASRSFNSSFGTVWYGPTASGLYVRYGVVANTRYDAAVYCCRGRSFDDLSAAKRVKLLRDGDFSQFAELFNASKPELTDDWSGDSAIVMAWNSARQLYGETYCWNARYTNDQKIRAQEAIEDVLNDDDTSSGDTTSPEIPDGDVGEGSGDDANLVFIPIHQWAPSDYYQPLSYVAVDKDIYNRLVSLAENTYAGDNYVFAGVQGGPEHTYFYAYVGLKYGNGDLVKRAGPDSQYELYGEGDVNISYARNYAWVDGQYNGGNYTKVNATRISQFTNLALKDKYEPGWPWWWISGFNESTPVEPPDEWPDPPTTVTPTPPDVPTPPDPIDPTPPDPIDPTPPNPWIPIPGDTVDITGEDFQDLIDALDQHCQHLQASIQSNVSQLWSLQSEFLSAQFDDLFGSLDSNFTWLGNDVIIASFTDLKSYLKDLFDWLADRMDFNIELEGGQYDDTSVIYWLKQIWSKLPTGINTKPSDPVTNPDGWWDWLTQLLNNLAADLMMLGHDSLAGVLETLNQLRNKFPFSLPWDVAAMLGLLVGPAVCPEFDVPCYAVSMEGLQQVGTYHITLEAYETVWQGVKWIETLAFAVYLIMNTSNLMDMVQRTVRPR